MQTCYLAVDIGASSGRHIIGTVEHGVMALHEVYRFENRLIEKNGHLCWDMEGLVQNVIEGLKAAHDAGYTPTTVGIDTWAVDFLLLDADGTPIGDPVAWPHRRHAGGTGTHSAVYKTLRPYRHPVPVVQHGLPTVCLKERAPGTACRCRAFFDGAGLPELPPDRRDGQRVHQCFHHCPGGRYKQGLGR